MTSRKDILERIWQNKPEQRPLLGKLIRKSETNSKEGLLSQFIESLKKAGAEVREFEARREANKYIEDNFQNAVNLLTPEIKEKYKKSISKEELEMIGILIAKGQFGVAENGAVWIDDSDIPNRLLPFVTQQLVLVLNKTQIVSNMHEAYQRTELSQVGFGVFISGPSKTADIEQSLVYGAHGAKEFNVLII